MALFSQFQYGDGVLYGALSPVLVFQADVTVQSGGARHGSINVSWDINSLVTVSGVTAMMIVARPLSPATVPEEGEVMFQSWFAATHMTGDAVYSVQAGTWTYFSLFVMGTDRRWRWVSFRLALPVSAPVTSSYGMRLHPILGYWKLHDGTDFGAACGTPIRAAASGVISEKYFNAGYGNRLFIDHGSINDRIMTTAYNHLSGYAVSVGQRVSQGQIVGYVGTTGYSTGCHLHLMLWVNGSMVDPMRYF